MVLSDNAQELQPFRATFPPGITQYLLKLLERYETGDDPVLRGKSITYWSNLTPLPRSGLGAYVPQRILPP